ncbi:Follistatin-related protein 4 [Portunus trituberculatus]|uniref:Follistatin-related protein 4 n=1 Tax=Portunus trituberculatus TaxID=210409 RepID=A0A5B7K9N5_PORTR|nr:Follistatin-related protein 4 [Portunus trituberculatus]
MVNQYGVATCQCPHSCAPVVTPVCGTDKVTYESRCHLEKEACVMQKSITVAFVGSCGKW